MCQHPIHQVNVSRKGGCLRQILANFLRHPVLQLVNDVIHGLLNWTKKTNTSQF